MFPEFTQVFQVGRAFRPSRRAMTGGTPVPPVAAAFVALFIVFATTSGSARAASCCMTSALFGVGRLALWEQSAVGLRLSGANTIGSFGSDSVFHSNAESYVEGELRFEAFGTLRVTDALELSALAAFVEATRGMDGRHGVGGAFGDAQVALRYEAINEQSAGDGPTLAFIGSALLPTGKRFEDSTVPFAADANSRGAFGAGLALSLEQTFGDAFAHLNLGGTTYLPVNIVSAGHVVARQLGPTFSGTLTIGAVVLPELVAGAFVSATHDLASSLGPTPAPKSAALVTSAGLTASFDLDPHWTVVGTVGSGLCFDGFGTNRPCQVSAAIAVRHGVFEQTN